MIKKKDVEHIAKLARLGLTEKEREKMQKELSSILDYIEKLGDEDKSSSSPFAIARVKEVDISKTEPPLVEAKVEKRTKSSSPTEPSSYPIKVENVMRNDEVRNLKPEVRRKIIEQAPKTKSGYLKVKSITRAFAQQK
jgi:aspartyl-tRNA(Asn)/glutamyl-tRNA(Gln) amidotransferase subunit C